MNRAAPTAGTRRPAGARPARREHTVASRLGQWNSVVTSYYLLTGATAERFEIVKWFYIEVDDDTGFDAAADIIARAMTNVHPAVAGQAGDEGLAPVPQDLLDDIATVLGVDRWDAPKVPAAGNWGAPKGQA